MKRFLAALCIAALVGCSAVPLSTFNDKIAAADRTVQLVQTSATALLRAGKLSVDQDQALQAKVGAVHHLLVAAKKTQVTDPAAASAALTAALTDLNLLKTQTGVK